MRVDVAVVGSGFGGSVAALRLVEKGYSVAVVEAGSRFTDGNFAKNSWDLRRFLYLPKLGLHGIQRIHLLRDVVVLAGAGVGGGSLVYANTMYVPGEKFFQDPQWRDITDWQAELQPWYDQASRMLGVADNPRHTPADEVVRRAAEAMGRGHTFRLTPVAVHFGDGPDSLVPDPYFGGVGPARRGCTHCGECMTGCRHNAKNTLLKNYLGLAEQAGVTIYPDREVTKLTPIADGWRITVKRTRGAGRTEFEAGQVVMAAGALNTQRLLLRMKAEGLLPRLSEKLGHLTRTNSESLMGVMLPRGQADYSEGVAITSSFYPDENTHVEPVRYGKGSNSMGLLQTLLTRGHTSKARRRDWWRRLFRHPGELLQLINLRGWSERTVIALVMQNLESSVQVEGRKRLGRFGLTSRPADGTPSPKWIPMANEVVELMAEQNQGLPAGNVGELMGAPITAHLLGGCVIGNSAADGVIDPYHRVWGYPTLHVVDGSAITANLGVNPSLTITAQAERAFSMWPNRGQADPRPSQDEAYQRIAPVPPTAPVVPASAPAALWSAQ